MTPFNDVITKTKDNASLYLLGMLYWTINTLNYLPCLSIYINVCQSCLGLLNNQCWQHHRCNQSVCSVKILWTLILLYYVRIKLFAAIIGSLKIDTIDLLFFFWQIIINFSQIVNEQVMNKHLNKLFMSFFHFQTMF